MCSVIVGMLVVVSMWCESGVLMVGVWCESWVLMVSMLEANVMRHLMNSSVSSPWVGPATKL